MAEEERKDPFEGAVVSGAALVGYKGPGRLADDPVKIPKGIDAGRLPLPTFLWKAYDRCVVGEREEKKGEKPGYFPQNGGKMAYEFGPLYHSDGFYPERMREIIKKAYKMSLEDIRNEGLSIIELGSINEMNTMAARHFGNYEPTQAFEVRRRMYVTPTNAEGTEDWMRGLRGLWHEYYGMRLDDHEGNHPLINRQMEERVAEYLGKAKRESMN